VAVKLVAGERNGSEFGVRDFDPRLTQNVQLHLHELARSTAGLLSDHRRAHLEHHDGPRDSPSEPKKTSTTTLFHFDVPGG
jgi:hypothetical protein